MSSESATPDPPSVTRHLVYKRSFKHLHDHQPLNPIRPVLKPFKWAACWFALGIDPFTKLGDVLFTGVSMKIAVSLVDLDEANASMLASAEVDDPKSRPALREYSLQLFDHVIALIPGFEDILREFLHDASQLLALFSFVRFLS
ncbi:hypothetical protein APHAL10511_004669 [Amanita phalloides]|nr:hypothetical protein APHAL10511_004669 [Amanita phalloides]